MSIACGIIHFRFALFLALGLVGRFIRFGGVVLIPVMWKALLRH
jgi:membrane protein YqaA with SNARE-associated domain